MHRWHVASLRELETLMLTHILRRGNRCISCSVYFYSFTFFENQHVVCNSCGSRDPIGRFTLKAFFPCVSSMDAIAGEIGGRCDWALRFWSKRKRKSYKPRVWALRFWTRATVTYLVFHYTTLHQHPLLQVQSVLKIIPKNKYQGAQNWPGQNYNLIPQQKRATVRWSDHWWPYFSFSSLASSASVSFATKGLHSFYRFSRQECDIFG